MREEIQIPAVGVERWTELVGPIAGSGAIDLFGDANSDGRVDLLDFAVFQICFTDAGGRVETGCERSDFDGDADVDGVDFLAFSRTFIESGR